MFSKFILSCLVACTAAFPHISLVNQGPQTGPLTPAYGDLVQTPRGLASIALEGFSEDLNQDGYVDPVGQATVPVAVAQPVAAPVTVPHVAPVQYAHAAPVATHTVATHAIAPAPAAIATHAVAANPLSVAAAPSLTYSYATPVAAAPHSHTIAATPAVAYPAAHAVQAVAPAATVPIAAAAAPVAAVHAQAHGACVNNFGAVV